MTNYRDILDVHTQIYAVIPAENNEFRNELENYINSIWNLAPEIRKGPETFISYTRILYKYIPDPHLLNDNDQNWKIQVRDIFNGVKVV